MKKLNNKGFSLVELIIVIAIMAILVGIVGTQVIPYLENSRKAKDQQVISAWNTAAMSAYSNAAAKVDAGADYEILVDSTQMKCTCTAGTDANNGAGAIETYFFELTGIQKTAGYAFSGMSSKAGQDISKVVIKIESDGKITTTTTNTTPAKYNFDVIYNK